MAETLAINGPTNIAWTKFTENLSKVLSDYLDQKKDADFIHAHVWEPLCNFYLDLLCWHGMKSKMLRWEVEWKWYLEGQKDEQLSEQRANLFLSAKPANDMFIYLPPKNIGLMEAYRKLAAIDNTKQAVTDFGKRINALREEQRKLSRRLNNDIERGRITMDDMRIVSIKRKNRFTEEKTERVKQGLISSMDNSEMAPLTYWRQFPPGYWQVGKVIARGYTDDGVNLSPSVGLKKVSESLAEGSSASPPSLRLNSSSQEIITARDGNFSLASTSQSTPSQLPTSSPLSATNSNTIANQASVETSSSSVPGAPLATIAEPELESEGEIVRDSTSLAKEVKTTNTRHRCPGKETCTNLLCTHQSPKPEEENTMDSKIQCYYEISVLMKAYQNKHSAMVSFEYARSFLDSNDGKILPAWIGMEGTITKRIEAIKSSGLSFKRETEAFLMAGLAEVDKQLDHLELDMKKNAYLAHIASLSVNNSQADSESINTESEAETFDTAPETQGENVRLPEQDGPSNFWKTENAAFYGSENPSQAKGSKLDQDFCDLFTQCLLECKTEVSKARKAENGGEASNGGDTMNKKPGDVASENIAVETKSMESEAKKKNKKKKKKKKKKKNKKAGKKADVEKVDEEKVNENKPTENNPKVTTGAPVLKPKGKHLVKTMGGVKTKATKEEVEQYHADIIASSRSGNDLETTRFHRKLFELHDKISSGYDDDCDVDVASTNHVLICCDWVKLKDCAEFLVRLGDGMAAVAVAWAEAAKPMFDQYLRRVGKQISPQAYPIEIYRFQIDFLYRYAKKKKAEEAVKAAEIAEARAEAQAMIDAADAQARREFGDD